MMCHSTGGQGREKQEEEEEGGEKREGGEKGCRTERVENKEMDRQTNRPWTNENMHTWVSNECMNK